MNICVQLKSSHGRDSLTFLSVSGGVGEAAGPLVSSAVGSPGAVAGISGSSAYGAAGSPVDIVGPPFQHRGSYGLHCAWFSGPFLQDSHLGVVPPKTAPSVKVVKGLMAHLNS